MGNTFGDTVAESVQDLVSGGKWPGLTGSLFKDEKMSNSSDMSHFFLISPPALMRNNQEGGTGGAENTNADAWPAAVCISGMVWRQLIVSLTDGHREGQGWGQGENRACILCYRKPIGCVEFKKYLDEMKPGVYHICEW